MMKSITPTIKAITLTWFIVLIASLVLVGALNLIIDDEGWERAEVFNEISM